MKWPWRHKPAPDPDRPAFGQVWEYDSMLLGRTLRAGGRLLHFLIAPSTGSNIGGWETLTFFLRPDGTSSSMPTAPTSGLYADPSRRLPGWRRIV